jgi:hypothetical protein
MTRLNQRMLAVIAVPALALGLGLSWQLAPAQAQTISCPEGYVPIGGADVQGCAPNPDHPIWQNSSPPAPSGPVWATRWGAVAVDAQLSRFGGSEGHKSERGAIKAAIKQCQANGGGKSCKVTGGGWYNQCGALAWGDQVFRVVSAGTSEEATQYALSGCGQSTKNCKIYYSGCSHAERVR